jgi:hypothetical protein
MCGLPASLARQLRDDLDLRRGIETGTFRGGGARLMAEIFPEAASIELSAELHAAAVAELADVRNLRLLQGDSRRWLPELLDPSTPTLYFLDGHWSSGDTAGEGDECPVLDELRAIAGGHPDDVVLVDDARFFTVAPEPPNRPEQWPGIVEVFDQLRAGRPDHHVTLVHDVVVAVPQRVRGRVDAFGRAPLEEPAGGQPSLGARIAARLRRPAA